MTFQKRNRMNSILRAAAPLAIATVAAVVLFCFPPEQYSFYPQCPIYRYLHLQCPGCGTTRALAALLHGNIVEAFRLDALTMLLMPLAVIYAILWYRHFLQRKAFSLPKPRPFAVYAALAIAIAFTIARNLGHL